MNRFADSRCELAPVVREASLMRMLVPNSEVGWNPRIHIHQAGACLQGEGDAVALVSRAFVERGKYTWPYPPVHSTTYLALTK